MQEPKATETISSVLSKCHTICCSIQERLQAVSATPSPESEPPSETAPAKAGHLINAMTEDLESADNLRTRLNRIEEHLMSFIDQAKALL